MSQEAGLALLTAASVPGLYCLALPPLSDMRAADPDQIRRGQLHGAALSLAVGAAASMIARKPWPLLVAGATVVYLTTMYARAGRSARSEIPR